MTCSNVYDKWKQSLCLYIFLFVNFIFLIKYLDRVTDYSVLISCVVVVGYFLIWHFRNFLSNIRLNYRLLNYVLLAGFLFMSCYALTKVDIHKLNVDRWSIITAFWDNYNKGEYVYYAKSFVGSHPGPMPFYFVLAYPFLLLGELGYFSLMGIVTLFIFMKSQKIAEQRLTVILLMVMSSCWYLWEVFTRSNIFINSVLVLAVIVYTMQLKKLGKKKYLIAILIGLVMSTRNVFVIPFIIQFFYLLRKKSISVQELLMIGSISFTTFCLTFVPFVMGYWNDFVSMNPFIIQSSVLIPFSWSAACIVLFSFFFFLCKNDLDVGFYSGLALFLTILAHLLYQSLQHGLNNALFESYADISYFMLGIPFTLYYLTKSDELTSLKFDGAVALRQ